MMVCVDASPVRRLVNEVDSATLLTSYRQWGVADACQIRQDQRAPLANNCNP